MSSSTNNDAIFKLPNREDENKLPDRQTNQDLNLTPVVSCTKEHLVNETVEPALTWILCFAY